MKIGLSDYVQVCDLEYNGLLGFAIAVLSVRQNNVIMCFKVQGFMRANQSIAKIYVYTLHSAFVRGCSSQRIAKVVA